MKKIIFFGLILIVLFLISCSAPKEIIIQQEEDIELEEEINGEGDAKGNAKESIDLPPGQCTPSWRCISSSTKAWQLANCSFSKREECPLGCENDTCKIRDPCTVGFKCKNDYVKGYQLESCEWTSTSRCEFGCQDAECLSESNVTGSDLAETETEETVVEESEPRLSVLMIREGEEQTVGGHNLSIYLIEPSRVRLKIDEKRSDWLEEGEIFTAKSVTVVVAGILFQGYQGGLRAVEYTVE